MSNSFTGIGGIPLFWRKIQPREDRFKTEAYIYLLFRGILRGGSDTGMPHTINYDNRQISLPFKLQIHFLTFVLFLMMSDSEMFYDSEDSNRPSVSNDSSDSSYHDRSGRKRKLTPSRSTASTPEISSVKTPSPAKYPNLTSTPASKPRQSSK